MMCGSQPVNLDTLLTHIVGEVDIPKISVTGIAIDSRKVKPGDLFLAMPGALADGRDYIDNAITAGAVAILVQPGKGSLVRSVPVIEIENLQKLAGPIISRFYSNPSQHISVIGVTGTNGKTSVSQFIAQLLEQVGQPCAVMGTLGFGTLSQLKEGVNTTADVLSIHSFISELRQVNIPYLSMEVSSHGLHQYRVEGLEFDVAVYTNLSRDHLDYHADMDEYAKAKARLFGWEGLKHAVINLDDEWAPLMLEHARHADCLTYAIGSPDADIRVNELSFHGGGIEAHITTPWGESILKTPLLGRFNLYNVLAAVGVMGQLGFGLSEVLGAVTALQPVPGRLQCLGGNGLPLVVIDYAHTPDAICNILSAVREHSSGKLTCIFGCGGDRDRGKRPLMAQAALAGADHVVVTSDNPRTENPETIIEDIVEGVSAQDMSKVSVLADRSEAISSVISQASSGDIIVVAGKGHETYQEINGIRHHFSDLEEVDQVLTKLRGLK